MERMLHIHEQIRSGRYPNCTLLAGQIEVCTRTVKRDIDFMKYRLDLPIEYDTRRYGFYYAQPVHHFPSAPVSESELFALLVARKAVAQYHGTPFHKPLEAAYRRLTQQLSTQRVYLLQGLDHVLSFRPFAPEDTDLETFEVLTRALKEHRTLEFRYRNLGAARAQARRVNPYHLACVDNHWYLFAFDLNRQAMRTFSLTRLTGPELTVERFEVSEDFDPDEYLKGAFTVFKGPDDFEVVLEFDRWGADLVRGRRWHASQEITELSGGSMRMRLRLNNIQEVERWVLSYGTHATVVRPLMLAERIEQTTAELQQRYAQLRKQNLKQ
jgi:proteasome accessory factor B